MDSLRKNAGILFTQGFPPENAGTLFTQGFPPENAGILSAEGFPPENTGKLCLRRDHSWSGRSLWKMMQLGLSTWISLELMIRVFFSISTEKNVMVSDS